MTRGERFHIRGYEPMAYLQNAHTGQVIAVVHNGSSHILVAKLDVCIIQQVEHETHATLISEHEYYHVPDNQLAAVYGRALADAVMEAMK